LPSRSKIPPQLFRPLVQVSERRGELVEAFGFHVPLENEAILRALACIPLRSCRRRRKSGWARP
jgi:hypothetical protein